MTLITGGAYTAMALLFAYGIHGFISADMAFLRSNSNLISLLWLMVAIAEFIAYALYSWCFGFASERMVSDLLMKLMTGSASTFIIFSGNFETECRILRSR